MNPVSDVALAYDRWAQSYDHDRNATRDLDATVLRGAGLPVEGASVLELGCGTGKNTRWLAHVASRVTALDFSAGMLARAREAVPAAHVSFHQQDLRDTWSVAADSIDVVIGNLVLEHVEDLAPIFANAARVLRPGGLLFLCELHPYRQLRGSQAHFTDSASGETVLVTAFVHSVSEYVNGGIAAGLALTALGEHTEDGAPSDAPPRLLSVTFRRASGA